MRAPLLIMLSCLLLLSIGQSVEASTPAQSSAYRVQLRSRQFVPAPGVEPSAQSPQPAQVGARHVLVQLNEIPTPEAKQALAAKGIRLLHYVPDRAWFASVEAAALRAPSTAGVVRWLGEIQVADKLPARLLRGEPMAHAVQAGSVRVRLYYFDDVSESTAMDSVTYSQGVVEGREAAFHVLVVRAPLAQVAALAAEDAVRWLEEVPPAPAPMVDTIRSRMRVNEVHAAPYNLSGSGTVLGIWDCSVVWPHVDFAGRLTALSGQTDACSPASLHTTHVAGIMAGSGANSQAVGGAPLQWKGVAPAAQIVTYDFYSSNTEVGAALEAYNIDLAQNSWGFLPDAGQSCSEVYGNYNNLAPEYDQIVTGIYGKRIPAVFAAGNQQNVDACAGFGTVIPPSSAKNVIAVGATNSLDDSMPSFSSWGPADDGRIKPDVVAPGYRSDFPSSFGCSTSFFTGIVSTCPGNGYGILYGTSMATPAVSGMLSLMLQQYRLTTAQPSANPYPSTLKALTIHGAVDLGNAGPDYKFGWGRVDAKNSADLTRKTKWRENTIGNSQIISYTANVFSCDASLKATLVWDDPAAVQNPVLALVNDLDLKLIAPNGTEYLPWVLNPGAPNNPATRGSDSLNNVEQVLVSAPMSGAWTVRVRGSNVPQGPQRFSLVSESLNTPTLSTAVPSAAQPGTQIVLRGTQFDAGCAPGNLTVTFAGGASVVVTPANYTFDSISVTVPNNAVSGPVTVTTVAGTSNAVFLAVVRPIVYLPLIAQNYPPPFNWIDASSGGTRIVNGDDVVESVALPFTFSFFGNTYNSVNVSSNGFITFGGAPPPANANTCIPNPAEPNNAVYAFWTDLDASAAAGGAVWAKTVGNTFVIEWQRVPRWSTQDFETFEVILGADSSVTIQYLSMQNTLNAVVGEENAAGTGGVQNYCNGNGVAPYNNQVVYYQSP